VNATHYDTLGVSPDADAATVRRAWVDLARRNHPDLAGEDPGSRDAAQRRMQEINEAWEVLGDESRRRRYDATLAIERRQNWQPGAVSPEFVPFDTSEDPDDPAAEYDRPYGDGSTVPRSLQVGPLPVLLVGFVVFGLGLILRFGPLVGLGAVIVVAGVLAFVAAPLYAVFRSSRGGLD
jgi:hypothetical protein